MDSTVPVRLVTVGNSNSSHRRDKGLFRTGDYHKHTTLGKRRVKDGECCAIWDSSGNVRNVLGPKLEYIYNSDVRFLDRFVANQNEYLVVAYKNGRKEHVRGPASLFLDPVVHKNVSVEEAVSLNAFEAIVVYKELGDRGAAAHEAKEVNRGGGGGGGGSGESSLATEPSPTKTPSKERSGGVPTAVVATLAGESKVERRVIWGPTLFIPAANEWVHSFSWHGSNDRMDDHRTIIKDALKLTKIRTLPDQLYYNVASCRTSDDAQLSVRLMIFYQMVDLTKMLDSTHDPIGDFVNAASADVIRFTAANTLEQFIHRSSDLNELSCFPVLASRAESIGYKIDKVVFRGYKASDQLQAMHDAAIKTRTSLQLESKTAEQKQTIEDLTLSRKLQRGEKEREMETANRAHALELSRLEHAERLRQADQEAKAKTALTQAEDGQKLEFLRVLGGEGVDLTAYLVAKERKGQKVMSIENNNVGGAVPHIHLTSER
mmetsp:Transcript_75097/g.150955  ORF Transcript_75097/g.150955 Transcript_75097/m.150955 type:complete len:489 (+) Transcript_75097:91-1557(+)